MKQIILLLTLLISTSALANSVDCKVTINGEEKALGLYDIPQTAGEPEGAGQLLLASDGPLKVYVTTYPIMIFADYFENEVVIASKHSSPVRTFLTAGIKKEWKATLKTKIGGMKVKAVCIEL